MSKQDYPFGKFGPEHLPKLKQGIEHYNCKEYWECHEALEDVWLEDSNDPARYVYWAIIQVATSLFHYRNGNLIGAQGMLKKAKEKFKKCEDSKIESDIVFKYLQWRRLKDIVFSIDNNAPLENFKKLHDFKFEDYKC